MSPKRPPLELVDTDHGMNAIAEALHGEHRRWCGNLGISPWDFCCALANVQARIFAGSKDMPEAKALERIDALRDIVRAAYRDQRHPGPGGKS